MSLRSIPCSPTPPSPYETTMRVNFMKESTVETRTDDPQEVCGPQGDTRDGAFGEKTPPAFIPLTFSPAPEPAMEPVAPRDTLDVQLEIVLRNGRRILVPAAVDPEVLVRLLPVLDGR